ncbi:MAG: S53 family peptidase [Steroidobacteraceae bacterium]
MDNILNGRYIAGGILAAAIALACGTAAAAGVPSSVAGWVKGATKIGSAPGNRTVTIALHMALSNATGLQSFAEQVSSPGNRQYGHYLNKEQFAGKYAPERAAVDAAKVLLERAGMSGVEVGPMGTYVTATATVDQLRKTFGVNQDLYSYKGLTLRANTTEPRLPAALAGKVLYVEGLDDTSALRTPFHHSVGQGALVAPAATRLADAAAPESATQSVTPPPVSANNPSPYCNTYYGPRTISATLSTAADVYGAKIPWLGCGYTPQQIQAAYGLDKVKQYDGTGVTVAITDAYASPTLLSDSNRYAENHKLPKLTLGKNFSQIIPEGIYSVSPTEACQPYGWWGEQSLDMAAVHGAAPGAHIIYVGSRDCGTSLDLAFFNTVYNHIADIVTSSWGNNGESIAPGAQAQYDQVAMAGAAQGVTVLFSSGDEGDLAAPNGVASGSWPATSAWVTGVGGTSLEIKDPSGAKSEYGWGNYRDFLANVTVKSPHSVLTSGLVTTSAFGATFDAFSFYAGSGGGISVLEAQPAYQAGVVPQNLATTLNLASGYTVPLPTPHRVSPDVSMVADPYTGYLVGQTYTIAGDKFADAGCKPTSKTEEYCEIAYGGTSLASPLMAGVIAIMDQQRAATGDPTVGFANPLLYSVGSRGNGVDFNQALNQIVAPAEPVSLLRGYAANLSAARVVTLNSVPYLISTAPYALLVCGLPVCLGINDVYNYTSLAAAAVPPTPAGYNDVTGLGVPYLPKLINAE